MKLSLTTILTNIICVILMVTLIAFTSIRNGSRQVKDLMIEIIEDHGNYFIDHMEVISLVNGENTDFVLGLSLDQLDLKELEARVEENAFVKDAQIFYDISGNLKVNLIQTQPIARILNYQGSDRYVDKEGNLLPLNTKHTARVPIVELEGETQWQENLSENGLGSQLLEMLRYVEADEFWKAQIAHVVVDRSGEVTLLPQITKQEVQFGQIEDIEKKFRKLKIFYKEVLPAKGWNTYSYVNLKYKNQIVCK